ncbi:MAG: type VI secretion system membrane subunit TssM [Anaeromyxobacter sp.]
MIFALLITVPLLGALWALVFAGLVPTWLAVLVTALTLLSWLGLVLWRVLRARRSARQIEQTLNQQADAQDAAVRPDQQAELDALRAEFQKAVAALKSSKLARGGKDALALLPWYVIIGPPGAGKSTALRASGLQFPYLSARGGGVRGVGGTRNCEWWLCNEAVLLDTAGRYTTQDEDREEWLGFLDMLARTRPRKPINGLLIAVSMADLGAETEEGAAALAQTIRERVDEVMARLQIVLPAYVLFTKCDLVPGFVETFNDLRKQERGQLWGFTVPVGEGAAPGELFRERFGELMEVLRGRALARLGEERTVPAREKIWQFPQQLQALGGNLAAFVDTLFQENVFQDSPMFRGVYFTSGTQEGRTLDRLMGAMADAFGIRPHLGDEAPRLEPRSYFLRDVFKKVLFPDQHLAVRNAKAVRRQSLQRWALAAGAAVAALLIFLLPLRAYVENRELVARTDDLVTKASAAIDTRGKTPRLDVLEPLREHLEALRAGPTLGMRFGMYQGEALLPGTQTLYAAAVRKLLAEPVLAGERLRLASFTERYAATTDAPTEGEYAAAYDRLKLLLMLSKISAGEVPHGEEDLAWEAQQLVKRWAEKNPSRPADEQARVEAHALLYVKLVAEDPALALEGDDGKLIRDARSVLVRVPYTTLALQKLIATADGAGLEVTLPTLLNDTVSCLRNPARVRGAFTRQGYEQNRPGQAGRPLLAARDLGGGARRRQGRRALRGRAAPALPLLRRLHRRVAPVPGGHAGGPGGKRRRAGHAAGADPRPAGPVRAALRGRGRPDPHRRSVHGRAGRHHLRGRQAQAEDRRAGRGRGGPGRRPARQPRPHRQRRGAGHGRLRLLRRAPAGRPHQGGQPQRPAAHAPRRHLPGAAGLPARRAAHLRRRG